METDEDFSSAEAAVLAAWEQHVADPEGQAGIKAKKRHDFLLEKLERARQGRADVRTGKKTIAEVQSENKPTLKDFITINEIR